MRRRAFTLIELLIAFAISTILIGAIYFFYIGIFKQGTQTEKMVFLNQLVEVQLEKITRDIKSAVELIELKPRHIRFKRYKLPRGELSAIDLETRRMETIEYRIEELEGNATLVKQIGFETPKKLFTVRKCCDEVFRGYVLQLPADKRKGSKEDKEASFPLFKIFDTVTQSSSELSRIPLVKVHLKLSRIDDEIDIAEKIYIPMIFSNLVEPDWNSE